MTRKTPPPDHDYDSTDLVAIGVAGSIKTLDGWAWKKINLPYAVVAGKRWYRKSDVDHYLYRREVKVTPAKQRR